MILWRAFCDSEKNKLLFVRKKPLADPWSSSMVMEGQPCRDQLGITSVLLVIPTHFELINNIFYELTISFAMPILIVYHFTLHYYLTCSHDLWLLHGIYCISCEVFILYQRPQVRQFSALIYIANTVQIQD